jgi:site-specific DNA-methyltransferase (adenine-specific)
MSDPVQRNAPGRVRDAIKRVLAVNGRPMAVREIEAQVEGLLGPTPTSSIRSYLRLNLNGLFVQEDRGYYALRSDDGRTGLQAGLAIQGEQEPPFSFGKAVLHHADCFDWIAQLPPSTIHAVVTDPPYGLHEYSAEQQAKLRNGHGGVWRIPPAFDGHQRSPLPRFTTLTADQLDELRAFFLLWGRLLLPKLVPGANVLVASNPLLSYIVAGALSEAGLERRGEVIRLVMTMRGGDRPKAAHEEFSGVSVLPRSMWEPWLVYRKALDGRAQDNLRKWKTGGFRRPGPDKPFGDVIESAPTRSCERAMAPHPSLKPQAFLRRLVRAVLPLGEGLVLDPFAGAGSTLAAAEVVGYSSVGIERDRRYFRLAREAIPRLSRLQTSP